MSEAPRVLQVTSPSFAAGAPIPNKYTCKGEDVSPAFAIGFLPKGTKSLALILDDPDAPRGTWTHWTAWNIPADLTKIPEDVDLTRHGARQGTTSAGSIGYHGPCPPSGTHRYFLRVYALGTELALAEGATRKQLDDAMVGNVLAMGELMGTYART